MESCYLEASRVVKKLRNNKTQLCVYLYVIVRKWALVIGKMGVNQWKNAEGNMESRSGRRKQEMGPEDENYRMTQAQKKALWEDQIF